MKKFLSFFCLVAYVVGAIGGFGFAAWGGSWFVAICVAVLAAMAFPFAKERFKDLTSTNMSISK